MDRFTIATDAKGYPVILDADSLTVYPMTTQELADRVAARLNSGDTVYLERMRGLNAIAPQRSDWERMTGGAIIR